MASEAMIRLIRTANPILIERRECLIEFAHEEVGPCALELALLLGGMTRALRLRARDGMELEVSLESPGVRAKVRALSTEHVRFDLARNQAEYLEAVLLRAYRDGMAEVSHIHLEGDGDDGAMDLTVLFRTHAPPMTPDEAAKRLRR